MMGCEVLQSGSDSCGGDLDESRLTLDPVPCFSLYSTTNFHVHCDFRVHYCLPFVSQLRWTGTGTGTGTGTAGRDWRAITKH